MKNKLSHLINALFRKRGQKNVSQIFRAGGQAEGKGAYMRT